MMRKCQKGKFASGGAFRDDAKTAEHAFKPEADVTRL